MDCSEKVLRKMPKAGSYHTTPRRQNLTGVKREIYHVFSDDNTIEGFPLREPAK